MSSYKTYNHTPQNDFSFLVKMGLKPHHKLLDVGCGGGRMGFQCISYLEDENYFGFDKEENEILRYRTAFMKDSSVSKNKNPNILIDDFLLKNIDKSAKFDFVYAYSVFTHVGPDLIGLLLSNLKQHLTFESKFYATFMLGSKGCDIGTLHKKRKKEYTNVWYTPEYLEDLALKNGYNARFIGNENESWEGVKRKLGDHTLTRLFEPKSEWHSQDRFAPYFTKECLSKNCPATYKGIHTHSGHQEMMEFSLRR